jgi:hypothetical protein
MDSTLIVESILLLQPVTLSVVEGFFSIITLTDYITLRLRSG